MEQLGHLYQENENYHLVDALPYIDTQYAQAEMAQEVKRLIDEEMRQFAPKDYLKDLPMPELKVLNPENETPIGIELRRVANQQPMHTLDSLRYQLEPPTGAKAGDLNAWKQAAENAQCQLEHGSLRLSNLELMSKFGAKAWASKVADIQEFERSISEEVAQLRNERDGINKKRKLDQVSTGNDLRNLVLESEQYIDDNGRTEVALKELEMEVERLQENCIERDCLPEKLKMEMEARQMESAVDEGEGKDVKMDD